MESGDEAVERRLYEAFMAARHFTQSRERPHPLHVRLGEAMAALDRAALEPNPADSVSASRRRARVALCYDAAAELRRLVHLTPADDGSEGEEGELVEPDGNAGNRAVLALRYGGYAVHNLPRLAMGAAGGAGGARFEAEVRMAVEEMEQLPREAVGGHLDRLKERVRRHLDAEVAVLPSR